MNASLGREDSESDEELMARYVQGDPGAFEAIYARHSARVYSFLVKRAGSRDVADDLHQAAFMKFHRSRERYQPKFALLQWLYVIAKTVFLDHVRKRGREVPVDDGVDTERIPAPELLATEVPGMEQLTEEQRRVVEWRFLDEESYDEIAARLGKTSTSVRKNVSRALKRLRSRG